MIKKNTKIIFEDGGEKTTDDLIGGIPLSKGEIVHLHNENSDEVTDYEVADKKIDCIIKGEDRIVNIVYILRRK